MYSPINQILTQAKYTKNVNRVGQNQQRYNQEALHRPNRTRPQSQDGVIEVEARPVLDDALNATRERLDANRDTIVVNYQNSKQEETKKNNSKKTSNFNTSSFKDLFTKGVESLLNPHLNEQQDVSRQQQIQQVRERANNASNLAQGQQRLTRHTNQGMEFKSEEVNGLRFLVTPDGKKHHAKPKSHLAMA